MSTVDKMLIKGIRSFDPENKNVITFFRPLTLIVGPNGAGKTTIIECLKVACTGELPPNSRSGQSFIHDPKVAGETETKGQIKLRFKTAAKKDVVCIRSYQLTQKASKMEFKAIESVLQTIDPHTGEKVCLSYRCADMDREIPALMGVSKAVLENVIFVHQDDSSWPLQDPSTLKKKFDDIFSATRYTKALEVIKKLHKDQAQEIKTYNLQLTTLQHLKDAAHELRGRIAEEQEKTEQLESQMQKHKGEIETTNNKIYQTEATLKDIRDLQGQIVKRTAERSILFKEQQKQYAALSEENEDTDEELMEWKTKFDERIAILESKISKLEREETDTNSKSTELQKNIKGYIGEISKLQAEAEAHLSLKNERDMAIKNIFRGHNLGGIPDGPFRDEVVPNLINRVKRRLLDLEEDLKNKKKSNEIKLKALQDQFHHANKCLAESEAQRKAKADMKGAILKRIADKENERDSVEVQLSHVDLAHLDEKEKNLAVELKRKTDECEHKYFESNIQKMQTEIYTLEQQIKSLNHEKDIIDADSEERVRLSFRKTELENLKKKHKKIMDEYKDRIRAIFKGRLPAEKDLKNEIMQVQRTHQREFDDLSSKAREAEKEVNTLQMKIDQINDDVYKLHKDMESKKRFVETKLQSMNQEFASVDSYPEVLDVVKEKRDKQKSKYNIADGMRKMFDPFEKVARAHHMCPCCERPFTAEEEDQFVKKQRMKSASSAEHMKVLAVESSDADSQFQRLDKLRIIYEEYLKICKELIPLAERTLNDLREELEQKTQSLDDVLGVLAQTKAEKDVVDALIQPIETADRLFQDIQVSKTKVDELEYKLDLRGQGAKSKEEIQSELHKLESRRDNLRKDLEKLRDEQITMEHDLAIVRERRHVLAQEIAETANLLRDVKKADEEIGNLLEEKRQLELEEKHLAEALGPLSKETEKLGRDCKDLGEELQSEYDGLAELKMSYQQEVDNLLTLTVKITEYNRLGKGERLRDLQEKQALSESQLHRCETRMPEIVAELTKSKDLMRNQDHLRRNIEDNLNYRKTKGEVDRLTSEIESLEDRILKIGGISLFEAELEKLSKERDRLRSELDMCVGTASVHKSNISKYKIDLKQAKYKDIDKRYFDQLIQLKTTEMANKDLDRYYNALDKALMRFHTMKMEEINKIIRELWQQTYRGQDIDYIRIHSDSEGAGTRSYSYRVLMQTGHTELEMRGRCSAGQKVLASLIIRLALAETFCLNCGILALDEPTTNLDSPNTESLAAALLRIMEDRKGQENFQLIVITHDERFAQLIGQRQLAEKYYRISKDDHLHSIIEAQEIFD